MFHKKSKFIEVIKIELLKKYEIRVLTQAWTHKILHVKRYTKRSDTTYTERWYQHNTIDFLTIKKDRKVANEKFLWYLGL